MVAELYPWPAVDGYRQRLHHLISGLAAAGEVDLFTLSRPGGSTGEGAGDAAPPVDGVRRVLSVPVGEERGTREWLAPWARSALPRRLLSVDWTEAVERLAEWRATDLDLVWYSHVDAWWPTRTVLGDVAGIVDFDNLENLALRLRRRIPPRYPPHVEPAARARITARWATSRAFDLVDERRWDRIQRRCADEVAHVVVCSDLDAVRSGAANAVVVPNGCDRPDRPAVDRRALRGDAPTMLFVGSLDYEPNTEAVGWFVRDVLPIIVEHRPDAVVRIVGRGAEALSWVDDQPGAELVGPVVDLRAEIDRAGHLDRAHPCRRRNPTQGDRGTGQPAAPGEHHRGV